MIIRRAIIRPLYGLVFLLVTGSLTGLALLLESKIYIFNQDRVASVVEPFPVGVDTLTEAIVEQPEVEHFFRESLASNVQHATDWQRVVASVMANKSWYQILASPVQRVAVIWPGERHEQVVKHFGDILGWDTVERDTFANLIQSSNPVLKEGKFFPGTYTVHKDATPAEVADLIYQDFSTEVLRRYTSKVAAQVPIEEALTIASLLEREAGDFNNMREISGVIWNRLFTDMPLQLDATLQYARANNPYEPSWWPVPRPSDKFINSPYNTYQNPGLPPGPIANPSPEAILAALNPKQTDCFFYFHTKNGKYHCSSTYDEHVGKLQQLYGQGS